MNFLPKVVSKLILEREKVLEVPQGIYWLTELVFLIKNYNLHICLLHFVNNKSYIFNIFYKILNSKVAIFIWSIYKFAVFDAPNDFSILRYFILFHFINSPLFCTYHIFSSISFIGVYSILFATESFIRFIYPYIRRLSVTHINCDLT